MDDAGNLTPVCPKCGSSDIQKDATAAWDHAAQDWELCGTQDNCTCEACGWSGDHVEWRCENQPKIVCQKE